MPLYGTFGAMSLPDLLQWLGTARRTGTLRVERNKVSKSIVLRDGSIVGCSSDDPSQKLGQFLLARGLIDEQQLRDALELQATRGTPLGATLVEMGAVAAPAMKTQLAAQTEEMIYSLFEWDDAVFRFQEGPPETDTDCPVTLSVEEVLLRGLKRWDEIREIRLVFDDAGIVLRHTGKEPPRRVLDDPTGKLLYELVDGRRSVARILLQAHSSEYAATRLLYDLLRAGCIEIRGDESAPSQPPAEEAPVEDLLADWVPEIDGPARSPSAPATELEPVEASDAHLLGSRFELVRKRMAEARFEEALDILDDLYRRFPGDESLRRQTAEAEAAFTEKAYRHYLPPAKVPLLTRSLDTLEKETLSPTEFFLLSRMDGSWDVRSIIQIAPIREADALRTLKRLREQGVIELHDPE